MARCNLYLLALCSFTYFSTGESLRCWSCSSDMDAPCSDYFNTTAFNIRRYNDYGNKPQLMECDHSNTYHSSKPVCLKKKQTTYGRTTYIRQCSYLHDQEKVGTCPSETTSSATTIDFCEYCDFDGCNGSSSIENGIFLTIFSSIIYLLLKQ